MDSITLPARRNGAQRTSVTRSRSPCRFQVAVHDPLGFFPGFFPWNWKVPHCPALRAAACQVRGWSWVEPQGMSQSRLHTWAPPTWRCVHCQVRPEHTLKIQGFHSNSSVTSISEAMAGTVTPGPPFVGGGTASQQRTMPSHRAAKD